MTDTTAGSAAARELCKVRQSRRFTAEPVSESYLVELLEVARWTGSSTNSQPWHFVVVTAPDDLRAIGAARPAIAWVGESPLAIALVLNGDSETSEAYDEGRVTERLLIAARYLGLGAGTAWIGEPDAQAVIKQRLGIPAERTLRSVVVIGHPQTGVTHKLGRKTSGRKPLDEVSSRGHYSAP